MDSNDILDRWQPIKGSRLQLACADYARHAATVAHLTGLYDRRTGELVALRQRAEAVGPEADPLMVMQDRQLEPVLLELLTAIRKARAQALEQRHTAKDRLGRMVGDLTRAAARAADAPELLASVRYRLCLVATDTVPQTINGARLDQGT